ncbi:MAG: indolepyruvate oxidoreductase subunit beta [Paludibacter sp.]|nr:indolepyruvate oxidoreductase subunit beta [Paludibacter sp.]
MTTNIILAGVGGQGILTIAAIIDQAAMRQGLYIKQAEVHGMSQRGGAVQSHLRISDKEIFSDLISLGSADIIISLEPMEALRYLPWLAPTGIVITATKPFINIPDYPETEFLLQSIQSTAPTCHFIDADQIAREAGSPKSENVVMTGAASRYINISNEQLRESISRLFEQKGETITAINLKAFELGNNAITNYKN